VRWAAVPGSSRATSRQPVHRRDICKRPSICKDRVAGQRGRQPNRYLPQIMPRCCSSRRSPTVIDMIRLITRHVAAAPSFKRCLPESRYFLFFRLRKILMPSLIHALLSYAPLCPHEHAYAARVLRCLFFLIMLLIARFAMPIFSGALPAMAHLLDRLMAGTHEPTTIRRCRP